MSNYCTNRIKCPKCGHSPIQALDDTPRHHQYTFRCGNCNYQSLDTGDFTPVPESERIKEPNNEWEDNPVMTPEQRKLALERADAEHNRLKALAKRWGRWGMG